MQGGGCYLFGDSSSTLNRVVSRALLALFFLNLVAVSLRALIGLLEQENFQTKKRNRCLFEHCELGSPFSWR